MCNIEERAGENKPSWKNSELRLLASFTLPNHLKPCHTNTAVRLCCWSHRSEGQMISQLHFCSVRAHKLSQLKGCSNKQRGMKCLQEKNNTNKLVCFIAALCTMQSFHCRVIFRHVTNKKNQEYFSFYSSLQKNPWQLFIFHHPQWKLLKTFSTCMSSALQHPCSTRLPARCALGPHLPVPHLLLPEPSQHWSRAAHYNQCLSTCKRLSKAGSPSQPGTLGFWYPAFSPGRRTSQNKQVLEITDCPTLFPRASDFPILFWVFTFEASINSRFHFFTFETSFYSCLGFWRGRGKIRDCPQEKVMLCSFITYTSEDRMESAKLLLLKQMQTVQAFSFCFVPFLNGVYVQLKLFTSRQIWMIYIKFWLFFSTLQAKEPFSALSLRAAQVCSRLTKLPCSSSIFPLNKFLHWTSSWFAQASHSVFGLKYTSQAVRKNRTRLTNWRGATRPDTPLSVLTTHGKLFYWIKTNVHNKKKQFLWPFLYFYSFSTPADSQSLTPVGILP